MPVLDEIDAQRGPQALYSAHELEAAILFQRAGERGYRAARGLLAGDMHNEARLLLGFDRPRGRKTRGNPMKAPRRCAVRGHHLPLEDEVLPAGAPSRGLWPARRRAAPARRPDARQLAAAALHRRHQDRDPLHRAKYNPSTGEVVNPTRITAPDAGYVPPSAHPDKAGNGWNLVALLTEDGVPIAHRIIKLNEGEAPAALDVLADLIREIEPLLPDEVRVLTSDGGFTGNTVRDRARDAGCIENIQCRLAWHQPQERGPRREAAEDAAGHRGLPQLARQRAARDLLQLRALHAPRPRAWLDRDGRAQVSIEGGRTSQRQPSAARTSRLAATPPPHR